MVGTFARVVKVGCPVLFVSIKANIKQSPWKKTEKARHDAENVFFRKSLNGVKEAASKGDVDPSYAKTFLEGREKGGWEDEEWSYLVSNLKITVSHY